MSFSPTVCQTVNFSDVQRCSCVTLDYIGSRMMMLSSMTEHWEKYFRFTINFLAALHWLTQSYSYNVDSYSIYKCTYQPLKGCNVQDHRLWYENYLQCEIWKTGNAMIWRYWHAELCDQFYYNRPTGVAWPLVQGTKTILGNKVDLEMCPFTWFSK